jgi:eukaryotic-like serine/threonine-protein kinase
MRQEGLLDLPVGTLFHDRYSVVRRIKTGGMGAVYEVVDANLDRRRALKVMLPQMVADPDLRARFELEAKATAKVHSEHVVETIDTGVDRETGAPFLVMELLEGEDLHAVLHRRGRLPAAEVVTLLHQAALALDRIHAVRVIHRDLKPGNLFLARRDDGSPRVKVLDFGIAKMVEQNSELATRTRTLGTPAYMSPEQIRGDGTIGPRADLYSLGHIAYTLLTGKAYWDHEGDAGGLWSLVGKIMQGPPELATDRSRAGGVALPAAFDAWFSRATAFAPEDRFATASELVGALAIALDVAPRPEAQPEQEAATLVLRPSHPSTLPSGAAPPTHPSGARPSRPPSGPAPSMPPSGAAPAIELVSAPGPAATMLEPTKVRRRWGAIVAAVLVLGGLSAALTMLIPRRSGSAPTTTAHAEPAQVAAVPPATNLPPPVTPATTAPPETAAATPAAPSPTSSSSPAIPQLPHTAAPAASHRKSKLEGPLEMEP